MSTIDLLKEAAEIIRDPVGRDKLDVELVAEALENIATLAQSWGLSDLLRAEEKPMGDTPRASTKIRDHSRKILCEFLRTAGFAKDPARR